MTELDITRVLENHKQWLGASGGARANLCDEDLRHADLRNADLRFADLSYADLRFADLRFAQLRAADLSYARLSRAYICGANLRFADLRVADLSYADLSGADLSFADLSGADLRSAALTGANLGAVRDLIDGGQRVDGYRFVGWRADKDVMILAGCRNMTLQQYREHNASLLNDELREETATILDRIESTARARGWYLDMG
jgi:uncharacterized protein YjbI with pentapeptide repeats